MPTPSEILAQYSTQSQISTFYTDVMKIVSVKEAPFSAMGDGATDDTAAIQAAIDSIKDIGGVVYFPTGTYIATNLKLYSYVVLMGAGISSKIKVKDNSTSTKLIELYDTAQARTAVRNLKFDGNKANQTIDIDCLYIDNNNNHSMYVDGFYDHYHNFTDLWITGFTGNGFIIPRTTSQGCTLYNIVMTSCTKDGIHCHGNDNIIINCTISKCGGHGFYISGGGQRGLGNKVFYNGGCGFYFESTENTYPYNGLRVTTFFNTEAQENDSHGIYLKNNRGTILTGAISSANGKNDATASNIVLDNSRYCQVIGHCENSINTGKARYALSILGNRSVFNKIDLMMSGAGAQSVSWHQQNYFYTDTINSTNRVIFNGIEYCKKNAFIGESSLIQDNNNDGVSNLLQTADDSGIVATRSIVKNTELTGQKITITDSSSAAQYAGASCYYKIAVSAGSKISASARCIVNDVTKVFGQIQINAYDSSNVLLGQKPSTDEDIQYASTIDWLTAQSDNIIVRDLCIVDYTLPANTAYVKVLLQCGIKAQGNTGSVTYSDLKVVTDDTGVRYTDTLSGSKTYDPPSLSTGTQTSTTVTVTGAELGDEATATFSLDNQLIDIKANVTSANTVTVKFRNDTGGTIDLGSGTLKAVVRKAMSL